ncbi:MAG: hypothetical protein H6605_07525 [Flavobacteriales bacterium]|nr:hypothetical protein [Flavobacteriales bacterium]
MNLQLKESGNLFRNPIVLGSIFLLLFLLCIRVPLWGNILLGFGSLFHAENYASFPYSITDTEYLRGYVYKIILFILMKITNVFSKMDSYYEYQVIAKTLYYLLCIGLSYIFISIGLKSRPSKERFALLISFWILMFTGNYRQFMEAEELAVIFSLGHFLFIFSDSKKANYWSGVFVFLLFGCKTITIMYAGFGLLYLLLFEWKNKEKVKSVILSHIIFTLLTFLIFWFPLHKEIENIQTAMTYQNSLAIKGIGTIKKFAMKWVEYVTFIPLMGLIPLLLLVSIRKGFKHVAFYLAVIVLSSMIVILQNRFSSPYHYLSFLPVVFFGLFYHIKISNRIFNLFIAGILIYTVFQNFNFSSYLEYASNRYYSAFYKKQVLDYEGLAKSLDENGAEEVLFVSGDSPPFYVKQKSATPQCSAIRIYRSENRPEIRETEDYKKLYASYTGYNGNFILLDKRVLDLNESYLVEIKEKLQSDYLPIYSFSHTPKGYDGADVTLFKRKEF